MDKQDRQEVENLILQAKLEIAETRLKMFFTIAGTLLGVFGVLIPLILAINSSSQIDKAIDRVDKSIEKMENSFKELAGVQLRKPEIECYFNGINLENSVLNFTNGECYTIEVKNKGNAPATKLRFHLYIADDNGIDQDGISYPWQYSYFNNEPQFSKLFTMIEADPFLDPQNSIPIEICVRTLQGKEWNTKALLKIYYGQEPKMISFSLQVKAK